MGRTLPEWNDQAFQRLEAVVGDGGKVEEADELHGHVGQGV